MGSFGWQEILLIAVVILILFGARKIPEFMRGLGRGVREFNEGKEGPRKELEETEQRNKTVSSNAKTEQTTKD
jgi:sec-independent protein translocase protein TatA